MSSNPPYLRLYLPGHAFGHPKLYVWQVCSLNDIEISGTSDDLQDALDVSGAALVKVAEELDERKD